MPKRTIPGINPDWIYDPKAMRLEEKEHPHRTLADLAGNELTNRLTHELGARLARVPDMENALIRVAEIIEGTYEHDAKGNREDGDSPMSGADVVDELAGIEDLIFKAIDRKPGLDVPSDRKKKP